MASGVFASGDASPTFQIERSRRCPDTPTESGVDLGENRGAHSDDALDAFARDAGYDDYADWLANAPNVDPNELDAEYVGD